MQFHNLIIDEQLPATTTTTTTTSRSGGGGSDRNIDSHQTLRRHVNAVPDKDGYGHETWVVGLDAGTHVRAFEADAVVVCDSIVVVVLACDRDEDQNATTFETVQDVLDFEAAVLTREIAEGSCVVLQSAKHGRLSSEVASFLHMHRKVKAVVFDGEQQGQQQQQQPAFPVVLRCAPSLITAVATNNNNKSLILLPLHYASVSAHVLPAAIVTLSSKIRLWRDCTQKVVANSPFFPGGQPPLRCPAADSRSGCACTAAVAPSMIVSEDIGTHIDSPKHFFSDGRSISDLTLPQTSELFAPGVIIDISERAATDADATVTVADLEAWEARNGGEIPDGALVVMRSGWSTRFADRVAYLNRDSSSSSSDSSSSDSNDSNDSNDMHFPSFSVEAADFLLERRNIAGLGVDTLSPDAGPSADFPVHTRMLGNSKYHVENMLLSKDLPEAGLWFLSAPLRVRGAYEAPCRCIAVAF